MADTFHTGLLTPTETSEYLQIPQSTLRSWLEGQAAGATLVHRVPAERPGQPTVPFVAVAEAVSTVAGSVKVTSSRAVGRSWCRA